MCLYHAIQIYRLGSDTVINVLSATTVNYAGTIYAPACNFAIRNISMAQKALRVGARQAINVCRGNIVTMIA